MARTTRTRRRSSPARRLVENTLRRSRGKHPTTRALGLVELVLEQGPSLDPGAIFSALSNAQKFLTDMDARRDHLQPTAVKAAVARKRR